MRKYSLIIIALIVAALVALAALYLLAPLALMGRGVQYTELADLAPPLDIVGRMKISATDFSTVSLTAMLFAAMLFLIARVAKPQYDVSSLSSDHITKRMPPSAGHGEKGTAAFMDARDRYASSEVYVDRYEKLPESPIEQRGWVMGAEKTKDGDVYYLTGDSEPHMTIVGIPGGGKSRGIILPQIYISALAGESMVITDPKRELLLFTMEFLKERGYDVPVFDFRTPECSIGTNPIKKIRELYWHGKIGDASSEAAEFASIMATIALGGEDGGGGGSSRFWKEAGESAIMAVTMLVATDPFATPEMVNPMSVYRTLSEDGAIDVEKDEKGKKVSCPLERHLDMIGYFEPHHPAYTAYMAIKPPRGMTRSGVFTTAATALRVFSHYDVSIVTSQQTSFDMTSIGRRKTALFLVLPEEREAFEVLTIMFQRQIYQALTAYALESGGKLPIVVRNIFEEVSNLPKFYALPESLSMQRSRRMRSSFTVQYLDGFDKYREGGQSGIDIITGLTNTLLYLSTNSMRTQEYISQKLGSYTIETESSSETRPGLGVLSMFPTASNKARRYEERPLLYTEEVAQWNPARDGALAIRAKQQPSYFPLTDISRLKAAKHFGMGTSGVQELDEQYDTKIQLDRQKKREKHKYLLPTYYEFDENKHAKITSKHINKELWDHMTEAQKAPALYNEERYGHGSDADDGRVDTKEEVIEDSVLAGL